MNVVAEENSCFVLYPSQPEAANKSRCWNWFYELNQQRDKGEPSIIADITRDVIKTYNIDTQSVFIAGMSAGGAMAIVMAATYPELYVAIGSHSGMPFSSARNVFKAMSAMGNGAAPITSLDVTGVPIIVFQGDKDRRVHPRNGDQIISQWMSSRTPPADTFLEEVRESNGRPYQRTIYRDTVGKVVAEHWLINGGGHAWSGGSAGGSQTDFLGPDASREMLRFFLGDLPRPTLPQIGGSLRRIARRYLRGLRLRRRSNS